MHRRRAEPFAALLSLAVLAPIVAPASLLSSGCHRRQSASAASSASSAPAASFSFPSPRIVSNQSATPVMLYGEGLAPGTRLHLGAPLDLDLPTRWLDAQHLTALIPEGLAAGQAQAATDLTVELRGPAGEGGRGGADPRGTAELRIVDDVGFPTWLGLAASSDERRLFVASPTTDEVLAYHRDGAPLDHIRACDAPRALATVPKGDAGEHELLAVACELSDELFLIDLDDPRVAPRRVFVGRGAQALAFDGARRLLYVSNHVTDRIAVIDLKALKTLQKLDSSALGRALPAGVNPRALALIDDGRALAVANLGSVDVSLVSLGDGVERRVLPRRGTPIVGGRTEGYSGYVMGGTAPRALAWSQRSGRLFVASVGPSIGPNPERMELSMNGGVGVIDPGSAGSRRFLRHLSILGGVPEALALDDARGLLYVADLSQGRLVVLDAGKLAASDASARTALVAALKLPPARGVDPIRPAGDLAVQGRAGDELYSGPKALALVDGGKTLFSLSRYSGELMEIDVSNPSAPRYLRSLDGPPATAQRERRRGEVLYFSDLGHTGVSCDACHLDGHASGLLYEKTMKLRIYRVSTLRDIRETPPYFFPGHLATLSATAALVLGRNRFHNPQPLAEEVAALASYQEQLTALPNPYHRSDGDLPPSIALPDGRTGDPRRGMTLFEGKAGCSAAACHAAPHFTSDQFPATRNVPQRVGTPVAIGLRESFQEAADSPLAVPSLTGVWDTFPLLASGAAGFVRSDDETLEADAPFALRRVLELRGPAPHGHAADLSAPEVDDLLAYLLTL